MAQVSHELLATVLAGEAKAFEELEDIERQKMIVVPTATQEGAIVTKGRPDTDTDAREAGRDVYENLETYLRNLLNNKKYHVDASLINMTEFGREEAPFTDMERQDTYDTYREYLFKEGRGRKDDGFDGIFRARTTERHGTIYTDIGLELSPAYSIDGEQVDQADEVKPKVEQTKTPNNPKDGKVSEEEKKTTNKGKRKRGPGRC